MDAQMGATFGNTRGFGGMNQNGFNNKKAGGDFDESFDRDSVVDFGFNNDLAADFNYGNNAFNQTIKKNQVNQQNKKGGKIGHMNGPPIKSSISDIVDKNEREAVFQNSMRPGGLFGNMHQLPGQSMTPFLVSPGGPMESMQRSALFNIGSGMGSPIQSPPKGPADTFKKFMPRSEKEKFKKQIIDEIRDFVYVPKKFFCKKHKQTEVEYCCAINETFFCKLCLPTHQGHDDLVLSEICDQIQQDVIKLKHTYKAKKEFMINKLDNHQKKIENIFKIYYETLDECRNMILGQEYSLRKNMDYFEKTIVELMRDIKNYNYIEFYHEKEDLQQKIKNIKNSLKQFNVYMPKYALQIEDMSLATNQIKVDLKERITSFIRETNHQLALDNYDYVVNIQQNEAIAKIYKQLGPFDFYMEKIDEDLLENKTLVNKFDQRKSGTIFRGEINNISGKPDGRGIKIFQNGSIYEGYFADGHTHGFGRGVTSRGEVFQGQFKFDQMEGLGFFQWPDGRMYEGEWKLGRRNGKGKYFWPNGQVYEGDFKDNECNGNGILHYTDGKRLEGIWRNGKKHGKAAYVWPNGAKYNVFYIDGKKQGEGMLEGTDVSLEQLKDNYRSLAKKSLAGRSLLSSKQQFNY
ncbi:UNKNOWN [Stylonychia lemnae]|uniref:Morn repeat protein n=1 Tax=Stylonychia lemnae TaxID=5949 RepID=A0A078B554_STYLE|nr:UNKNOWN [Stylonychia lemnae]|eukprot:CDW89554.1 UNKNOWN [Stylonychia lemnae]